MYVPLLISSSLSCAQDVDLNQFRLAPSTMLLAFISFESQEVSVSHFQNFAKKHPCSISVITVEMVLKFFMMLLGKRGPFVLQGAKIRSPFLTCGVLVIINVAVLTVSLCQVESILQIVKH